MLRCAGRMLVAILSVMVIWGCQLVGPASISRGRPDYNQVIQQTSKDQVFANIIRVRDHETMLFLDVTEVDAQLLFQAQVTGGAAGIGARPGTSGGTLAGSTGSASATLQYEELPTIRYQPLLGQPLVQQVSTPINVDSIANLYSSDWPLASILGLAADELAQGSETYFSALDAIVALDANYALAVAATKSELTRDAEPKECKVTIQPGAKSASTTATASASCLRSLTGQAAPAATHDSLSLYLTAWPRGGDDARMRRILRLWLGLLKIYADTQPAYSYPEEVRTYLSQGITDQTDLTEVYKYIPKQIELRTVALDTKTLAEPNAAEVRSPVPILTTHSALGVLIGSWLTPNPMFKVVSPAEFHEIAKHAWNSDARSRRCPGKSFYVLLPSDEAPEDHPEWHEAPRKLENERYLLEVEDRITGSPPNDCLYTYSDDPLDLHEEFFGGLRRYLLIVESDSLPTSSYVSYFDERHGKWFYIDDDDKISQLNFALIAQFFTMQAAPPSPPLTPTIPVGGRGS